MPVDLEGLKTYLKEKQDQSRELKVLIDSAQAKILELDPNSREKAKLVTILELEKTNLAHFVEVQGNVNEKDFAMASSETGGRLVQVNLDEGQSVSRGRLIARVDLEAINKQIAEVETGLSLARDTYERQKRLWDQKIGTEMQYLQSKNNVERLEKSLETLRFQLTKANVHAPISGIVDKVFKESGEMSAPGEPIARIINTSAYTIKIDVPENYLKSLKRGQQVEIEIPALDKMIKSKVSRIGTSIDPSSRTFEVEVDVNNRGGLLKPNLLATMKLQDDKVEDVFVLPVDIIQQEVSGKDYVYVVDQSTQPERAKKTYIETSLSYDGQVAVESGLKSGDKVVNKGSLILVNDDAVTIISEENDKTTE